MGVEVLGSGALTADRDDREYDGSATGCGVGSWVLTGESVGESLPWRGISPPTIASNGSRSLNIRAISCENSSNLILPMDTEAQDWNTAPVKPLTDDSSSVLEG